MKSHRTRWVRTAAWSGLVACAAYPTAILVPLPVQGTAIVIFVFAASLGLASAGLCVFVEGGTPRLSVRVGAVSNVLAGLALVAMGYTQLALREGGAMQSVPRETAVFVDRVQLGLDVVWDVYLALGTALFAFAMRRHPRLGRVLAWSGVTIAAALFVLNLATFPAPPADSGLVDVGPLVGLWYLAVTIQVFRSLEWFEETEGAR